ncbi:leucinerich repeat kinase [Pelomyxa schiedti]|nr:leucinerich repeat kinase [Pelomyxa schiedti]
MLDYKAADTLSNTLVRVREHFPSCSKTKLVLCVIDFDASLIWWRGGDKNLVLKRAEIQGIDSTCLEGRGCLLWTSLAQALENAESGIVGGGAGPPLSNTGSLSSIGSSSSSSNLATSTGSCAVMCGMIRVVQIRDKFSVKSMFEDVVLLHTAKKKKLTWKQSLPGFRVDIAPILLEKIPSSIKKRGLNDDDYTQIDTTLHTAISQGANLSDLLTYLIENELLGDNRALVLVLSHFPQGSCMGTSVPTGASCGPSMINDQNWAESLNSTYSLILDTKLTDFPYRVQEWVNENQMELPAEPPADVSLPFLMLETIPKKLFCQQSLTKLNLSHNKISLIPSEFFENVRTLQVLDLSWNRITCIPETVSALVNLIEFNMEHNELESLPVSLGDCVQMVFFCGYNKIASLPHSLAHHARLSKLHYQPNPLQNMPPQSISAPHELAQFLEEQSLHETTRWVRVKLVVVGPENVGKTTLLRRFQGKLHDGISTDGISIKDMQIRDLTFAAWDFGGQAVFLPTHQFFLTGRALYLVVFDLTNPHAHRIEYWLRQISKTVKLPPTPPVILVGTHADKLPSMEKAQSICTALYQQFKCIGSPIACIPVSAKDGDLTALEDSIIKAAITKQMILREKVPGNWIQLDKLLSVKRRTAQTVLWSEFTELAAKANINEPSKLKQAAHFLHGVGSIIYYESSYSKLGDIVILDPEYLASIMSTIVTFKTTMIVNGILSKEGLGQIWHNYDSSQHPMLIELLSLFLILYPIATPDGKESYIVPCALAEKVPPEANTIWPLQPQLKYVEFERRFVFPCLPIGLFGRLLVRVLHTTGLAARCFWKDNMRFEFNPQADARSQYGYFEFECNTGSTPALCLRVRQAEDSKPILLALTLEIVDTTIDCFYKTIQLEVKKFITCNHCPLPLSANTPLPHLFTYEEVVAAIAQRTTPMCKVEGIHLRLNSFVPELMLNTETQIAAESLINLQLIGSGGFGKIYKGEMDGKIVAVKELIVKQGEAAERFAEFKQEVSLMSMLDSPYIVKLFGVCMSPPMMIMEFISHGDLFKLLHAVPLDGQSETMPGAAEIPGLDKYPWLKDYPPGEEAFKYPMNWHFRLLLALDVARGLSYLHTLHPPVVHRDLRSPNVFIQDVDPNALVRAKVADFGLSIRVAGKVAGVLSTWQWLAPEIIDAQSDGYDEQADVFSLGIVMYEIATRQYPYDEYAELPQYSRKKGDSFEWREQNMKTAIAHDGLRPTIPAYVPREFASIILSCWGKYPAGRPTATQIGNNLATLLSQEENSLSQHQDLAPLLEAVQFWERPLGEQKIWSLTEDMRGRIWAGFADGTIRRTLMSTGEISTQAVNLHHKTRIYSILSIENELWASSEFGKIFVLDMERLQVKCEISAHGEKGSIASIFCVRDPRDPSSPIRVWSASSTESTIVVIDPKSQEVVNRLALEPDSKMTSIVQCAHLVWLGCWKRILTLDCSTMATYRVLPPPILGKYMCATAIGNRVWFGVQSKVIIYDAEQFNCITTLLGHEDDVSAICECNGYGWTADKKGIIIAWHPQTLITVKKLVLNDYLISCLFPLKSCLFYTAIHPKSCVGAYYFGQKPELTDPVEVREIEETLVLEPTVEPASSPPPVLSLALDTPVDLTAHVSTSTSMTSVSATPFPSIAKPKTKSTSFTIRKSRIKSSEPLETPSATVSSLLLDPVSQPRPSRRSVMLTPSQKHDVAVIIGNLTQPAAAPVPIFVRTSPSPGTSPLQSKPLSAPSVPPPTPPISPNGSPPLVAVSPPFTPCSTSPTSQPPFPVAPVPSTQPPPLPTAPAPRPLSSSDDSDFLASLGGAMGRFPPPRPPSTTPPLSHAFTRTLPSFAAPAPPSHHTSNPSTSSSSSSTQTTTASSSSSSSASASHTSASSSTATVTTAPVRVITPAHPEQPQHTTTPVTHFVIARPSTPPPAIPWMSRPAKSVTPTPTDLPWGGS